MEFIFDLLEGTTRVDTTTKMAEAVKWLTPVPGFPDAGVHSVSLSPNGGAGKLSFFDVPAFEEYFEGAVLGKERAAVWKQVPKVTSDLFKVSIEGLEQAKVNLKNAIGAKKPPLHPVPPIAFIALGLAMNDRAASCGLGAMCLSPAVSLAR